MCHRPGTAWQNAWTRPPGSIGAAPVVANTTPDVPSDSATTPGVDGSDARRRSPPGRRRRPRPASPPEPGRRGRRADTTPVTSGPSNVGGSQAGSIRERLEDLRRPVPRRQVEQQRARPVGLVERVLAGQPEPDVVLRQQDVGDPRPDVRLVVADPDELRGGEAGQRVVAGDRDEPLPADRRPDLVAGVRPSAGRSRGSPAAGPRPRVEQHQRRASGRSARPPTTAAGRRSPPGPGGSPRPSRPTRASGSCSLQSGCGVSNRTRRRRRRHDRARPRRSGRPSSPSSTRRSRVTCGHRASAGRHRSRPDRLVDQVLEQLLAPGHRLRVDLARRDLRLERRERLAAVEDRRPERPAQPA